MPHMHANRACPRNFIPSEIEPENIFSNLASFNVLVDKGMQNLLKCINCIYMDAYPCNYVAR